jgi:hypothetical protein
MQRRGCHGTQGDFRRVRRTKANNRPRAVQMSVL